MERGDYDGAVPSLTEALRIKQSRLGDHQDHHPKRESAEILARAFPNGHPMSARPLTGLGELLMGLDRPAEAEPLFRQALGIHRSTGGDEGNLARVDSLLSLATANTGRNPIR